MRALKGPPLSDAEIDEIVRREIGEARPKKAMVATLVGPLFMPNPPTTAVGMRVKLFPQRRKRPHAQSASNDHCDPGRGHRHLEASDMHWPLVQRPHGLKCGDNTEDDTRNNDILSQHFRYL
jgi:hypothetical protein